MNTPAVSLFPPAWLAAGILTPESAADFARLAAANPSRPARFWRWAAFQDFVEESGPLTAASCQAVYHLGRGESDANLGKALIAHVLYERACPPDVRAAAAGTHPELVRRIEAIRKKSSGEKPP